MNNETVNQEPNTGTEGNQNERTFTQADVDSMIGERLAREREKYSDYEDLKAKAEKFDKIEEESKTELQKATERADSLQAELDSMKAAEKVRNIREEVSKETGVPVNLLTASTKEECEAQAKDIIAFAKPDTYPSVNDGGEVIKTGKRSTGDQFADWVKGQL